MSLVGGSFTVTENPQTSARSAELADDRLVEEKRKAGLDALRKFLDTVTHPRGSADMDGQRVERRRKGRSGDSPMAILTRMPAVVVLDRIPVPTLAVTTDGIIVFANTAFVEMLGYEQDGLVGLAFAQIFRTVPAAGGAPVGADGLANVVVELEHGEGWTVQARMSKSALMRSDDPVMLVTFENLTEQLWTDQQAGHGVDDAPAAVVWDHSESA